MENPQAEDLPADETNARHKGRKRTKTGCLTCRKRRIKCGEERPVCKNCIKSKRHCDGYNQRVIFKPPPFEYQAVPHGGAHITFPVDPSQYNGLGNAWGMHEVPPGHFHPAFPQHPLDPQIPPHHAVGSVSDQSISPPMQHLPPSGQGFANHALPPPLLSPATVPAIQHADLNRTYPFPGAEYPVGLPPTPGDQAYPPLQAHQFTGGLFRSIDGQPVQDLNGHSIFDFANPTQLLSHAAVETHSNFYNAHRSDDIYGNIHNDTERDQRKALGSILQLNSISIQDLQTRRYDTFLYAGMLDTYRVERVASPLNNPATARVFAHFISATAPSLSIFERHPRNTSVLFDDGHIPFSEQGLWTYTMPKLALHNQGLLHAMLALGSLHIAKLTGAARTPSVQHYAWALKRVHHCVGHPQKRLEIATIAASMLLGYYEIIAADHMKWNLHLAGSKQLFIETDFAGMTKQFRQMKLDRAAEYHTDPLNTSPRSYHSQGDVIDQIPDIDERVVSRFVGREIRYGDHGLVEQTTKMPAPMDLSDFEILKDLFWWYCKQDAYMSVTGGIPLLLDYSRWADCPPRAPLGKIDAVYGSFDHLTLLLGRVADFANRDRVRKIRQVAADGGSWRPHKDMNMPAPPPQQNGKMYGSTPGEQPGFYGMAPPPRTAGQMPSSYHSTTNYSPNQSPNQPHNPSDTSDLSHALEEALSEYHSIRTALHEFSQSLGENFHPLTSEYQPPMETPFGSALFYRNYDIGCLWAIYNMTIIIAIRSHPYMPPAAHMAAAIAAKETEFYANEIGRISAGIVPDSPDRPLSPALGAALCESCMPSFFAAIQYKDAAQREMTVKRIFGISRRTGWGSAELIANGCETAWVKAAAAGRGPPYTRLGRQENSDDPRLNGSWEMLDPDQDPDDKDDGDRRLVKKSPRARLLWGIGVIGEESDETVKR